MKRYRTRLKKISLFFVAALLSVIFTREVRAEALDIPLYKFAPVKNVNLRCISNDYVVTIPAPERWNITKASLTVNFVNSINLIGDISQLLVKINDTPIAQARLNPLSPENTIKITIPPGLLTPGYNYLSFHAVQHYKKECEHPCAPDLWTTLKMDEAMLHLEYDLRPVPLKLSQISSFIYDPKLFPYGQVNIVTEDSTDGTITVAGVAASGIAKKFDYRKVMFSTSGDLKQGFDNILIGKKEFVEKALAQKGVKVEGINGPFIRIMHLPKPLLKKPESDPFHSLLVISGLTQDHLKLAAETLAFMNFPFPGTDQMIVEAFKMDNIALYGGLLMLKADKVYRFKTLGFNTHSFEGFQPSSREITFRLPADFLIKENQQAELKINFSYGAGMRADSALNILLNDTRVRVINLSKQEGDTIEGYKIAIPTFLFKPGTNTIKFTPVLTPMTRECEMVQSESLFLTVFENSTFYIPPMPHYVEMPQIGLFMMNGFPFTSWPDGYESSIYLTSADSNTINAALNLVGLITQRNSYPFFGVDIHVGKDSIVYGDRRDIIVIGDLDSIPEDLRMSAPIKMLKSSDVKYPVVNTLGESPTFVSSRQISGLGHGAGAIMEFQSPYKAGRTVLLLTATTTADLLTLSNAMLEPNIQGQSKGDVVVVEYTNPEFKVSTLDVGTKYFTGKSGRFSRIGYYLYSRPYLYFGLIFTLILFISGSVFYGLRKYRRKDVVNSEDSWIGKQEGLLNRLKALLIKIFIKK